MLLLFLNCDLYFLIPVVVAQIFNPTAQLIMLTRKQTNEANAEIERPPVTVEAKISKR